METAPKYPVPVFPLPDLVLFPRASVPLHVFELRYRTMVREALSRDRLIALALLKPGYEADYFGSPEFHSLGCLARFDQVAWLPDDRYDLKVVGTTRVRLDRVVSEFPYRSARVEALPEHPYAEDDPLVQIERRALIQQTERLGAHLRAEGREAVCKWLPQPDAETGYEAVVNTLCMLCGAPAEERLSLLREDSVLERGRRVREILEQRLVSSRRPGDPEPPRGDRN